MIALADFGMGNIHSIRKALELYYNPVVFTRDPDEIRQASALVLPGDGAFDQAMKNLQEEELLQVITEFKDSGRPVFGICIGFQILFKDSEEGRLDGLGWFEDSITRFRGDEKIPHMGWNLMRRRPGDDSDLMAGVKEEDWFYFIHSYHADIGRDGLSLEDYRNHDFSALAPYVRASCYYNGSEFPAVVVRDNVMATQFHPEKSFTQGLKMIENFCGLVKRKAA